ncbi:MAG: hypothetical protein ACXWMU_00805 [Candidatus Limnocylindrales bacterium]
MANPSPAVSAALASLRERWGDAAPRPAMEIVGALALAPDPGLEDAEALAPGVTPTAPDHRPGQADLGRIVPTGFPALDAILGPGGLPRAAAASLRGDATSGKTTLALRLAAAAQEGGGIVAYLDLARSMDPVEAVARGVRLEWLVVLAPRSLGEALAMAATLLQDRAVDLLLLDLPAEHSSARQPSEDERPARLADRLHRLAALARRAETGLIILEPPGLPGPIREALVESTGLRLELARRAWIRLGRDVVGQRTEVTIARNRFGPPGRRADLRILYADGGERDACLARPDLLRETPGPPAIAMPVPAPRPVPTALLPLTPDLLPLPTRTDATAPPALAPPAPPARPRPRLRLVPGGSRRAGRSALDGRVGARRGPARPRTWRPPRDAAGQRPPAGPGGDLPRPGPSG